MSQSFPEQKIAAGENWAYRIAKFFRRDMLPVSDVQHAGQTADVIGAVFVAPLALIGLVWLALVTDLGVLRQQWGLFLLLGGISYLIKQFKFYLVANMQIQSGSGYANADGTFEVISRWSAVLILGPGALWMGVLFCLVEFAPRLWNASTPDQRWNWLRNLFDNLLVESLLPLISLNLYRAWGGAVPLTSMTVWTLAIFLSVLVVQVFLELVLLWMSYASYLVWVLKRDFSNQSIRPFLMVIAVGVLAPYIPAVFAALAVWIYGVGGPGMYVFFMVGLCLVAYVAQQLSRATESSRQQSQQSEKLEQLARALLEGPPDASKLSEILQAHVPGMFLSRQVAIWLAPNRYLLGSASDALEALWPWLVQQKEGCALMLKDALPWKDTQEEHLPLVVTPVWDVERAQPIGGIYLALQTMIDWERPALQALLPTLQTLAAQIATALHQAKVYQETLAHQKTLQELAFARRVQTSFLPDYVPPMPGWQIAASLTPARQVSGDFYDFVPLPDGRLGILIADVADKGLGPALYMALSRTLIRTFALQLDAPADALRAANQRLLEDVHSDLFVTVFYAVLDPKSGMLSYCNAGHPPALLFKRSNGGEAQSLGNTGMALGVDEGAPLRQASVTLQPGDVLFLYTDGVTDAQNTQNEFIDLQAAMSPSQTSLGTSAEEIKEVVLERIRQFVGDAPQFDDITMIVLTREV